MYYFSKPIVFGIKDEAVVREIDRLSKQELEFCDYVSSLVEKDILEKLGRKRYDESLIIETEVTAVVKKPAKDDNQIDEITQKLDKILSMFQNNPSSVQMALTQPSYDQQTNDGNSLAIEVPNSKPIIEEVHEVMEVETSKVDGLESVAGSATKKKKKKGLFTTRGKDANALLAKMASMQK